LELQEMPGDIEHGQAVRDYFGKHLLPLLPLLIFFAPFGFFMAFLRQSLLPVTLT